MTVDVKICGLKTPDVMDAALQAGANYVGLVFYEPSPRNVAIDVAVGLAAQARGRAKVVALFVDPDDNLLDAVVRDVQPDVIQLHGSETPDRIADIRQRTDATIMKAVKVATVDNVQDAQRYTGSADIILFDAKVLPGALSTLPGGNGEAFDWHLLDAHDPAQPWMLGGGLNAGTVADAIAQTGATAVDVSSGVERIKGEKDVALIHAFVAAAKAAVVPDRSQEKNSGVLTHV